MSSRIKIRDPSPMFTTERGGIHSTISFIDIGMPGTKVKKKNIVKFWYFINSFWLFAKC
jgi:hypothetical protein